MKKSAIILALLVSLSACSAPAEQATGGDTATAAAALLADIGGTPTNPVFTQNKGETLAVSGYDVVSYFVGEGKPVEGKEDLTVRYQGYDYRFASKENADKFIAEPAKYVPQYGGYCAWAMGAKDALAPGNAKVYKIVDGKLYLNYSEDVAVDWRKDIPGFISKANANFPKHPATEHYQG